MPVTERLMQPGQWTLTLAAGTPQDLRDSLQKFGHIFVLEAPVNARLLSDANMQSIARWVGRVRRRPTWYQLDGDGLLGWLGDDGGKGQLILNLTLTTQTFGTWITNLLNVPLPSITAGTTTAIAGTLTATFVRQTQRFCLDFVMRYFGGEYRIKPNATIDAGPSSSLFVTTPTAVALARSGGRDLNVTGIPATVLDQEDDVEDYSTDLLLVGAAGTGTATISPATTRKDMKGNLVSITRLVQSPNTAAGFENAMAAQELAPYSAVRRQVTVQSDQYNLPRDVAAGDWIYVYDVDKNIIDTTNQVRYRGSILYPVMVRVFAVTWPFERGYAIYYRAGDGTYTDLTPYVAWEPPGTTLEVGAALRKSTQ